MRANTGAIPVISVSGIFRLCVFSKCFFFRYAVKYFFCSLWLLFQHKIHVCLQDCMKHVYLYAILESCVCISRLLKMFFFHFLFLYANIQNVFCTLVLGFTLLCVILSQIIFNLFLFPCQLDLII